MALKTREASLGVGLAAAALGLVVFQNALPTVAEAQASAPDDRELSNAGKAATWKAAMLVTLFAVLAGDPTVFIVGGAAVVGEAWVHKHANAYNPTMGSAMTPSSRQVTSEINSAGAGYSPQ